MNGEDDDGYFRRVPNAAACFEPAHTRHVEIEEHKIGQEFSKAEQGRFAGTGFHNFIVLTGKDHAHDSADLRLVVDNQNFSSAHLFSSANFRTTGSVKKNSDPSPSVLSTQMSPP